MQRFVFKFVVAIRKSIFAYLSIQLEELLKNVPSPTSLRQRNAQPKPQQFNVDAPDQFGLLLFLFVFALDIKIDADDKSKEQPNGVAAMAFVQAAANLRARCYALPCADRLTAQRVVGRLCPSMVCSLFVWLHFAFCC
jgi:hypothetical protein